MSLNEKKKNAEKYKSGGKESFVNKFKKGILEYAIGASLLLNPISSHSVIAKYYLGPFIFPGFEKEAEIISKRDQSDLSSDPTSSVYREVYNKMREKQKETGEGKSMELDYWVAYGAYALASGPPEIDIAKKYYLEAAELAKKYYEIYKDSKFLNLIFFAYKDLAYGYFGTVETARKGEGALILFKKEMLGSTKEDYTKSIVVNKEDLPIIIKEFGFKNIDKIIMNKPYFPYYEESLKWYNDAFNIWDKIREEYNKNEKVRKELGSDYMEKMEAPVKHAQETVKSIKEILEKKPINNKD